MNPSIIKKTQDTLGRVIKKPPLTEKLLSKPPFRFLHDIITEVIKNTGVLKGLFKPEELNSENVKDKEAKVAFLQKAIDCLGIMTGVVQSVRPSKIVAGHEPEKTNEFLQALGKVCIKKTDSSEAVKKTLAGEKPSSGKSRKKESSRSSSNERLKEGSDKPRSGSDRSKEKEKDIKKEERDRKSSRDDRKEKSGSSAIESSRKGRDEKEKNPAKEKETENGKDKQKEREREKRKPKEAEKTKESEREPDTSSDKKSTAVVQNDDENEDDSEDKRNMQRPSSAKGQRRRPTNSEADKEDESPSDVANTISQAQKQDDQKLIEEDANIRQSSGVRRAARPSSARPAPPKIKRSDEIQAAEPRLGSGKQMNAVIVDNAKDQHDDDDDLFVVEDNAPNEEYLVENTTDSQLELDDGQHGSLVTKMLDSKKEAEIVQSKGLQNKEKPVIIDATRKKEKEIAQKEIEKLRNSIQTLCRSAHPLGKIMDYLQEDIDSMQKEFEVWKKENKKYSLALKAEQSITESEIEPLHAQLGELELEITDMVDRISSVKSNIIRNDEKIRDMIGGVSR
eukprot:Seg2308.2 transcript_id=Seg2308.2/GoldUCD/mRNA.D3Y31 product="TRAF3-interacting protein 1" protein_id=Seg2308.2/GoldUCD/D3Y31